MIAYDGKILKGKLNICIMECDILIIIFETYIYICL